MAVFGDGMGFRGGILGHFGSIGPQQSMETCLFPETARHEMQTICKVSVNHVNKFDKLVVFFFSLFFSFSILDDSLSR